MKLFKNISQWLADVFRVWRRQIWLVFHDAGLMLFFFALPTAYPIVYSLIYNPEVVKEMPVAVVDHSRTSHSRELVRMLDATEAARLYDYVADMPEARRLMNEHKVVAILEIPDDYGKLIGSGRQAFTTFYMQMNLLLRYRTFVSALANLQIAVGAKMQTRLVDQIGLPAQGMQQMPVGNEAVMLGDPTQGFASFIMPGIVVLILQQSIVLGMCMLVGGRRERLRRNGGVDPLAVDAPASARIIGQLAMVVTLYMPVVFYILHLVLRFFNFPTYGDAWQEFSFIVPFIVASVFFGRCLGQLVTDRESSLLVVVCTSVFFLFLSGLTWPRFAMNGFWTLVSDCVPATWGIQGFININSAGGTLAQQSVFYWNLWGLAAAYFLLDLIFERLLGRRASLGVVRKSA